MASFSDKWIEDLKNSVNIIRLIEQYLPLKKQGIRHWACCPFHNEKDASFTVDENQQYFKCYGCGKSGDVITFVMEKEKLNFPEALEFLAKRFGIPIPDDTSTPEEKIRKIERQKIYDINLVAAKFYLNNLHNKDFSIAEKYLKNRGFSKDTIISFGLGVSLDYEGLYNHLLSKGFDEKTMINAKLINETTKGDFQAKRLVIPIIDEKSRVIGFGGRALSEEVVPKYKNTATNIVFDKSQTLYNMNQIVNLRKKEQVDSLILVEGYMDVIALHQAGLRNVIASMGTALTTNQCKAISKKVKLLYVCFDGDIAGQNATIRSLDMLSAENINVRVVELPAKMDPDDYIKKYGLNEFQMLLNRARPVTEFKILKAKESFEIETMEGKSSFVISVLPILRSLDPITRSVYIEFVSEISGVPKQAIETSINSSEKNHTDKPVATYEAKPAKPEIKTSNITDNINIKRGRIILSEWFLQEIDLMIDENTSSEIFVIEIHRKIAGEYLKRILNGQSAPKLVNIISDKNDDEAQKEIDAIFEVLYEQKSENRTGIYKDSMRVLEIRYARQLMREFTLKLKTEVNTNLRDDYVNKITKLTNRIKEVENKYGR